MKVLVIAAHPDDEILGVGGTMARLRAEGNDVRTFIYGEGRTDITDQRFDELPLLNITHRIEKEVDEYQPDIVFTHYEHDLNNDHRIIYTATVTACRPLPDSCVKTIYSYEVASSSEWRPNHSFPGNVWFDITKYLSKKIETLKELYDDEMRRYPHPRSYQGLKTLARYRGIQIGVRYAEAFQLVRMLK